MGNNHSRARLPLEVNSGAGAIKIRNSLRNVTIDALDHTTPPLRGKVNGEDFPLLQCQ